MTEGRDENGRFAPGNAGGPGRPRRTIERDYMAVLSDAVTLDDWRAIVSRAVTDAKSGDRAAREWISARVLGAQPASLYSLALREALGVTTDDELAAHAERELAEGDPLAFDIDTRTPLQIAAQDKRRIERERLHELEREQRRLQREAKKAKAQDVH